MKSLVGRGNPNRTVSFFLALCAVLAFGTAISGEQRSEYRADVNLTTSSPVQELSLSTMGPSRLDLRFWLSGFPDIGASVHILSTGSSAHPGLPLNVYLTNRVVSVFLGGPQVGQAALPPGGLRNLKVRLVSDQLDVLWGGRSVKTIEISRPPSVAYVSLPSTNNVVERVQGKIEWPDSRASFPAIQAFFTSFGLLLSIAIVLLVFRGLRDEQQTSRSHLNALGPGDFFVFTTLALWWLTGPLSLDDGWVLQTARLSPSWISFHTIFQTWDARVPIGIPQYLVYRVLTTLTTDLVFLRLFPLCLIFLSWTICRRLLLSAMTDDEEGRVRLPLSAGIIFSAVCLPWLFTLRPEPIVALLAVINLLLCQKYLARKSQVLILAGLAAGFSCGVHTSGSVAIAPILAVGLLAIRQDGSWRLGVLKDVFLSIMAIGTAFVLTVFPGWSITGWRENGRVFAQAVPRKSALNELDRYRLLLSNVPWDTALRRSAVLLIAIGLILGLLAFRKSALDRLSTLAILLALVFLAITPTKWPWHFGSASTLGAVCLLNHLALSSRANRIRLVMPILLTFCLVFVARTRNSWGYFFSPSAAGNAIEDVFSSARTPLGVAASVVLFGIVCRALYRNSKRPLMASFGVLAALSLVGIGLDMVMSFTNQASIARMNVKALSRPLSGSCGFASSVKLADVHNSESFPAIAQPSGATASISHSVGSRNYSVILAGEGELQLDDMVGISSGTGESEDYVFVPASTAAKVSRFNFVELSEVFLSQEKPSFKLKIVSGTYRLNAVVIAPEVPLTDLVKRGDSFLVDPFIQPVLPCIGSTTFEGGVVPLRDHLIGQFPSVPTSSSSVLLHRQTFVSLQARIGNNDFLVIQSALSR